MKSILALVRKHSMYSKETSKEHKDIQIAKLEYSCLSLSYDTLECENKNN